MNEIINEKLRNLATDEYVLQAVRSIFDEVVEKERPIIGEADDKLLGEKYRAYETAKIIIDQCFIKIASYKQTSGSIRFNKER